MYDTTNVLPGADLPGAGRELLGDRPYTKQPHYRSQNVWRLHRKRYRETDQEGEDKLEALVRNNRNSENLAPQARDNRLAVARREDSFCVLLSFAIGTMDRLERSMKRGTIVGWTDNVRSIHQRELDLSLNRGSQWWRSLANSSRD